MTIEEARDRELASWLKQNAKSLETERQHRERIEKERFPIRRFTPYEDIRASLEARKKQEALQETINEFNAKYNAQLQLAEQKLLGDFIVKYVDEKKRREHEEYLAWVQLIIMASRRS